MLRFKAYDDIWQSLLRLGRIDGENMHTSLHEWEWGNMKPYIMLDPLRVKIKGLERHK